MYVCACKCLQSVVCMYVFKRDGKDVYVNSTQKNRPFPNVEYYKVEAS